MWSPPISFFFFFNDTATTEIYTLSLHDALPICLQAQMGYDGGQIAGTEHLHRLHDGCDAVRDIADEVNADENAERGRSAEDGRQQCEGRAIVISSGLARGIGALLVKLDILNQKRVGFHRDGQQGSLVHFLGFAWYPSYALLRQGQNVLGALGVNIPLFAPVIV